ncbi:MAG: sigma-70 family RNA polymerase sigma factor [Phycisphaerae bacterium]
MSPTLEAGPRPESSVIKLEPRARLPVGSVLRAMEHSDARSLKRRLLDPIECVYHPEFDQPRAEEIFLVEMPRLEESRPKKKSKREENDDSGADLFARVGAVALSAEAERAIFLRLNYCRYRAIQILRQFDEKRLTSEAAAELLLWAQRANETRAEIVRANVNLVLAMVKRTKITAVDQSELVSEGNLALLRAVDKFDCSRGFKFSTYACRAILKGFSRVATRTARYRGHFPTEFDPTLERGDDAGNRRQKLEGECVEELKSILGDNLANLSDVEQRVIRARFALDEAAAPETQNAARTLEEVGELIGVTKERVRQIQNKALGKLRSVLEGTLLAG